MPAKCVVYLGLDPSRYPDQTSLEHVPLIQTKRRGISELKRHFSKLCNHTHVLLTSREAARYFFSVAKALRCSWQGCCFVVVGEATQEGCLKKAEKFLVAKEATQEGVIALLEREKTPPCFWPHSSRTRPFLGRFLEKKAPLSYAFALYDTHTIFGRIALNRVEKLVFTSPSTVDSFASQYPKVPPGVVFEALGPVTWRYLLSKYPSRSMLKISKISLR
ncbi:MAG: uroporphyrinogen-III synthase [Chlamydiota bacterium]